MCQPGDTGRPKIVFPLFSVVRRSSIKKQRSHRKMFDWKHPVPKAGFSRKTFCALSQGCRSLEKFISGHPVPLNSSSNCAAVGRWPPWPEALAMSALHAPVLPKVASGSTQCQQYVRANGMWPQVQLHRPLQPRLPARQVQVRRRGGQQRAAPPQRERPPLRRHAAAPRQRLPALSRAAPAARRA